MHRLHQVLLIGSTLFGSWLGMQAVHELGHVVGAWLTGGRVARVVLDPRSFSRTDLAENPQPLPVVWAGPILGIVAPLLMWSAAAVAHWQSAFVLRFFAGFCLVANGLYIGYSAFDPVGDGGDMLRHGSDRWQLFAFGIVTAPAGLWLWHGQGQHFGLGHDRRDVNPAVAYSTLLVSLGLLVLAFVVGT